MSAAASPAATAAARRLRALQLYRNILRAHRGHLPSSSQPEMKELGDAYVRNEFKLHKAAKSEQAERFLAEWEQYLQQLLQTARARDVAATNGDDKTRHGAMGGRFGRDLPPDAPLTPEQQAQLEKLRDETTAAAAGRKGGGGSGSR